MGIEYGDFNGLTGVVVSQSKQIGDYERVLVAVYRNTNVLMMKALIEDLAEKYQGDLKYEIDIIRCERGEND